MVKYEQNTDLWKSLQSLKSLNLLILLIRTVYTGLRVFIALHNLQWSMYAVCVFNESTVRSSILLY